MGELILFSLCLGLTSMINEQKSDFSADLLAKNQFSGGMETILTKKKKNGRKKIDKKSGKIADFSPKNMKNLIFSRKNPIFPEI